MSNTNDDWRSLDEGKTSRLGFDTALVRCWCEFSGEREKEIIIWRWDEPSVIEGILGSKAEWDRFFARNSRGVPSAEWLTIPNEPKHCVSGWFKEGPPSGALPWIQAESPTYRIDEHTELRERHHVYEFGDQGGGVMRVVFAKRI